MYKTIGDYFVIIFSIIGTIITIFAFGETKFPLLSEQGTAGVIFLGVIAVGFMGYALLLKSATRKKVLYAEVFEELNLGFSSIHSIERNEDTSTENQTVEIVRSLESICNSLSNVFSTINGHHIGVCIKILSTEGNFPIVITLVRDKKSTTKGRKTGKADNTKHYLMNNSDFNFIYSNYDNDNIDTSSYYQDRLPLKREYQNTRLGTNWPPKKLFFMLDNLNRRKNWPLMYRCTMVVPIVPLSANEQQKTSIRGFLCADSPKNRAFYKTADVEILKGVSDGIYKKIDQLYKLL